MFGGCCGFWVCLQCWVCVMFLWYFLKKTSQVTKWIMKPMRTESWSSWKLELSPCFGKHVTLTVWQSQFPIEWSPVSRPLVKKGRKRVPFLIVSNQNESWKLLRCFGIEVFKQQKLVLREGTGFFGRSRYVIILCIDVWDFFFLLFSLEVITL